MKRYFLASLISLFGSVGSKAEVPPFLITMKTAAHITDAVFIPRYNHVFFFGGSSMMPYDIEAGQTVQPAWYSLGELGNIDASVLWDDNHLLLFAGSQYVIYEIDSARVISEWVAWPSLPEEWEGKIDACVRWSEDELMFFSGTEYLLYSISESVYKERSNFTAWEGWPSNWQGNLLAVLRIGGSVCFLSNGEYISLDATSLRLSSPRPLFTEKP